MAGGGSASGKRLTAILGPGRFNSAVAVAGNLAATESLGKCAPASLHAAGGGGVIRDGGEREVAIEEVAAGDHVRVRPGERVPVDGRVVEGESAVDEAIVTGESVPVEKAVSAEVIGGSINQTGALLVEATRIGEEGFLHQVARHVEEAKAMKPGIVEHAVMTEPSGFPCPASNAKAASTRSPPA